MTVTENYLVKAYAAACAGTGCTADHEGVDAMELYTLALSQGIANTVYYSIKDSGWLPQEVMARFEEAHDKAVLWDLTREEEEKRVFSALTKGDISFLPLKGSVMRIYYPSTDMRVMGDTDIMIDKYARKDVRRIMGSCGYKKTDSHSGHDVYEHTNGCVFEVHYQPADGSRFHRTLMERAIPVGNSGNRLSLSISDFYLYMLSHLARHVRTTGAGLRMFGDIKVFYSRCGNKIDTGYVSGVLEEMGLTVFEKQVKKLIHSLFYGAECDKTTADFASYIMSGGVFGSADNYAANKRGTKSKLGYFISSVFPSFGAMRERYPFLKYLPFMLPFMWVFRWFSLLFRGKNPKARYARGAAISKETLKRNKSLMDALQLKRYKNGKQRMTGGDIVVSLLAICVLAFAIVYIGRLFFSDGSLSKNVADNTAVDSSMGDDGSGEYGDGSSSDSGEDSGIGSDVPVIDDPSFDIPEWEDVKGYPFDDGTYTGQILNGLPDGVGTYMYHSGKIYQGSFSEGKYNGKGVCRYTDGSCYDGMWFEGTMNGEGTWYNADGSHVMGMFVDGKIDGVCTYVCANGDEYEGTLKDGKWHGKGKFVWVNGDVYEGDFVEGVRHGQGKYRYADGSVYSGNWIDDEPNGMGTLTSGSTVTSGVFVDGLLEGEGTATMSGGNKYSGYFVHGVFCDEEAVLTFGSGGKYVGGFKDGMLHGQGTLTYSDGDWVKGTFEEGKLQGRAQYYDSSTGKTRTITYVDGNPQ